MLYTLNCHFQCSSLAHRSFFQQYYLVARTEAPSLVLSPSQQPHRRFVGAGLGQDFKLLHLATCVSRVVSSSVAGNGYYTLSSSILSIVPFFVKLSSGVWGSASVWLNANQNIRICKVCCS